LAVLAAAVFAGVDPRAEIKNVEGRGVFLGKPIVGFRGKIGEDPVFVSFIRFFGPAGSPAGNRSVANYEDVFNLDNPSHPQSPADREALHKQIEGKIVVIGDTSPEGQDVHRSPVWTQGSVLGGNEMPGVEIQAHAIQTVLSGLYIRQASDVAHTLLLLALCLVMAVVTRVLTPLPAAGVGVLSLAVLYLGSVWLLSAHSYWMEPVTASAGVVVTTLAGTAVMYTIEHRERMATRRQLDRHLGPGVAQALNEDEFPELGGESVEITLLFSDLQGFTSLSEKMDSKGMCGLLNRYFGDVIFPVLFAHGGTLDKMMGDGMMAYFGWIPKQPDHARRAALCALEMERALDAWLKLPENASLPPLRTRIGVHTGVATVGEIGAGSRAQFTVIGDVVNVAARLEAMNKEFGSVVLISDATRTQAGDLGVKFTERGVVQVRGRAEPLPAFSAHLEDIVGPNGASPEQGGSGSSSKVEAAGAGEKQ
jgi:adenylate cyclase